MKDYAFGAGGLKLGDRVEILTTGQRGVLVGEAVHLTGCNTYEVLIAGTGKEEKEKLVHNRDYLVLRKLRPNESMLDPEKTLTGENSFTPKGDGVDSAWLRAAEEEGLEYIPEIDEAIGVEEIAVRPGMRVWSKSYGCAMLVNYVYRSIFSKELDYGLTYMVGDDQKVLQVRKYDLIPMEMVIDVYPKKKEPTRTGPAPGFNADRDCFRGSSGGSSQNMK